jgi:hypothetical protein
VSRWASLSFGDVDSFGFRIADATPLDVRLRTGSDGKHYELVFSDEFNVDGRSFYEGLRISVCY